MKVKNTFFSITILLIALLTACNNDNNNTMHKTITGKAGELVVVITEKTWNEEPGELIRQTLMQSHLVLPQSEPLFDVVKVPPEGFKSIFKSTRNILQTSVSPNIEKEGISFKDDVWAYPQATISIKAKNAESFNKIFNENKNKIMSYYLKAEQERLQMSYDKLYERAVFNVLNENFDLTMKVPPGFVIADQKKDFIWLKYETPEISQGIILYTFPYVSDSAFTKDYQIKIRDSILKASVPGPTKGSYMATETRIEQVYNIITLNGNYASEMRGLWRLKNDFMGGPYLSLATLDEANQRVVVAFGYVYAPSKDKRNFLRQIEAMIYSMKLNNQQQNDKLNEQNSFEVNVTG